MTDAEYNESLVAAYESGATNDRARAAHAAAGIPELEARIDAADKLREASTLRTIERAHTLGLGWHGCASDVADLHRILRRAGIG